MEVGEGPLGIWFCHTISTVTDSLTFGNLDLVQVGAWKRSLKMCCLPPCCEVPSRNGVVSQPLTWGHVLSFVLG